MPTIGKLSFSPGEFNAVPQIYALKSHLESENRKLHTELADAIAENTRLRRLFVADGVVCELTTMRNRLDELYSELNTVSILHLPSQKEKVA